MNSIRRFSVVVSALVVCGSLARAQGGEPDLSARIGKIANWAAPETWSPDSVSGGISTMSAVTSPLPFIGLAPCRIVDTRGNSAPIQGGMFTGGSDVRNYAVAGICGIPIFAQALSLNFTVVGPTGSGFLVAWPTGGAVPPTAILNFNAGDVRNNAAVVPTNASVSFTVNVSAPTHVIIDINGYYGTPPTSGFWSLTGNSGTAAGSNFLGTTDNQALVLKVNGNPGFALVPGPIGSTPNVIGGSGSNIAAGEVVTICGGGIPEAPNRAGSYGTVGGGANNQAGDGFFQVDATVSGGYSNTASGIGATVPGGRWNTAGGKYSFAAGYRAKAGNDGSFVWADSTEADFDPTVALGFSNSFWARATGGFTFVTGLGPVTGAVLIPGSGSWSSMSDSAGKENFQIVEGYEVLDRLAGVQIQTWNYKTQSSSIRHIGPTSQDFRTTFKVGEDDRYISTIDADGISLAAIQALYEIVKEKDGEIEKLKARLSRLETRLLAESHP